MIAAKIDFVPDDGQSKAFPDLVGKPPEAFLTYMGDNSLMRVAVLENGTESGAPSMMFCFDLSDGRHVITEGSAKQFVVIAKLIEARYPGLLL